MKVAALALITSMAVVPAVYANFDIYQSHALDQDTGDDVSGFSVYQNETRCDEATLAFIWRRRDDVSGLTGFRADGNNPSDISVLEMNFGNGYHFTIYEEHDWDLTGLDGYSYGTCFPYTGDDFNCVNEGNAEQGGNINLSGARYFRCLTDSYDAALLNEAGWDSQ